MCHFNIKRIIICLWINQVCGNISMQINTKLAPKYVIELIYNGKLHRCADKCVYKTDCLSLGFNMFTKCCKLYGVNSTSVAPDDLRNETNTVLLDIGQWPKSRTGACWNKPCEAKEKCQPVKDLYTCTKDELVGCEAYSLPEHGTFFHYDEDFNGDVYPVGILIGLDCSLPYYTAGGSIHSVPVSTCQANFKWSGNYTCHTVEELCTHQVLERFYPERAHITVTSANSGWIASDVLLNSVKGWTATINDDQQHIQIWFDALYHIGGVVSRGGANGHWVTSYKVIFSKDCITYKQVVEYERGLAEEFPGNVDAFNSARNNFDTIIHAQCLRIHPIRYEVGISMRIELLACQNY